MPVASGLSRFLIAAVLAGVTTAYSSASDFPRYSLRISGGGYSPNQPSVSAALEAVGYRSVAAGFRELLLPSDISEHASVHLSYPGLTLGALCRFRPRLGIVAEYCSASLLRSQYANVLYSDTLHDRLELITRASSFNLQSFYLLRPYPGRKRVGVELSVSGGFSLSGVRERMNVLLPVADTAGFSTTEEYSSDRTAAGFSALFGFDTDIYFGRHFSFSPARILLCLSVVRPSFDELLFESVDARRLLPVRNYDLTGLYWQVGAAYHF
ncbi:MAG: hypothetical protein RL213_1869 [Bacteroidota bacterium]|jgi:hypothetical protein